MKPEGMEISFFIKKSRTVDKSLALINTRSFCSGLAERSLSQHTDQLEKEKH